MVGGQELVAFLTRSTNRLATLRALVEEPRTRRALESDLDVPRATLNRILADLRDRDLVSRNGHTYTATALGVVVTEELQGAVAAIDGSLRLTEIQSSLPLDRLPFPLETVSVADIVTPTPADPLAPVRRAEELLRDASTVRVAARNIVPSCIDIVADRVSAGAQTCETILTPDAVEVLAADESLTDAVEKLAAADAATLHVYDGDLPFALFVVDETVFIVVVDDTGAIQGHVETDDPALHTWATDALDVYREGGTLFSRRE